jgi:transposase InsO family protein
VSHRNAPLSELGRLRLARCVVEEGWPLRRAAERFQVAPTTAARWAGRYRAMGKAGMADRSSRPQHSPRRTPTRIERRIIKVLVLRRWGPARIGYLLGLHPSTVHRVLTRYGMAKLRWLDRPTGRVVRRIEPTQCGEPARRQENSARSLLAVAGACWAAAPVTATPTPIRAAGVKSKRYYPLHGYRFLHTAIDGYSRLAYTELLTDQRKETAAQFSARAQAWFAECGITVRKVLTDNGACYRAHTFADALAGIEHRRTRPYRPQTNGKVERFHRTLADEWAYARLYRSDAERCQAFTTWLHTYNHHRGHTALGGQPPASRVPNLSGQYN